MADIQRTLAATCLHCGTQFEYVKKPGNPQRYCTNRCYKRKWEIDNRDRIAPIKLAKARERLGRKPKEHRRLPGDTEWWCFACKQYLPIEGFSKGQYRCKACQRLYYRANADRIKANVARWERENLERARMGKRNTAHRRRARQAANGSFVVTQRDLRRTLGRTGGSCTYCGVRGALEIDHVVPISRGGAHSIGNLAPACRTCNASKSDRFLTEWRAGLTRPAR